MGSQYNNNIAEAIDILLNKRLSDLHYDQTIIAEIYEIIDVEQGKYKIQYESVIFDAESTDLSKRYKLNRSVYVKVPKSDFSQKLLIESEVNTRNSTTERTLQELKNYRIPILPIFEYNDIFSLVAGPKDIGTKEINPQETTKEYFESYDNEKESQFKILANEYEIIKLEAIFSNSLMGKHIKGNYGLRFNFLVNDSKEAQTIKSYTLDTSNFIGNIYKNNFNGNNQSVYYQIPKGTLKALKSITFFQDNMEQDDNMLLPKINEGKIIGYEKVTTSNLTASNIKITFYSVADLTDEKMYLQLLAPQGYYGEELNFEVQLLNEGKNIINDKKYSVFWYKKVLNSSEKNLAGQDWEAQNNTSSTSFKISQNSTIDSYKVMIIENNQSIVAKKEFEVFPHIEAQLPSVIETQSNNSVQLKLPEGYTADWQVNNSIIKNTNSIILTLKDFITNTVKVEYTIYKDNELGTSYKYISAPVQEDTHIITFAGTSWYQYDVHGEYYLEEAKAEKQMVIATITSDQIQENIAQENFYIGDFKITDNKDDWQKYDNTNSLLENVYYTQKESGSWEINYTIKSNYNLNKTNNTLKYEIIFKDGSIKEYFKEFKFSKTGDLGVNNGNYSCRLVPEKQCYNPTTNKDYVLNIEVYENGELITDNTNEKYSIFKLTLNNGEVEIDYSNNVTYRQQIVIAANDIKQNNINYITLTIKAKTEKVTTYFGIPIGNEQGNNITNIPTTYIKYNSDGLNPVYDFSTVNPPIAAKFNYELANGKNYYFQKYTINNITYTIIYFLNSFGNPNISNWDNKILIDEKNNNILTNQITAGQKRTNTLGEPNFSGIIIGELQDDTRKPNGIYGYKNNENIFKITEDNIFCLGNKINQVIIDGNNGTIVGGQNDLNGDNKPDSMCSTKLKLSSNNETDQAFVLTQNDIPNFTLNYKGELQANAIKLGTESSILFMNETTPILNTQQLRTNTVGGNYYFTTDSLSAIIVKLDAKIKDLQDQIDSLKSSL